MAIGNRRRAIGGDHVDVKVHQAFAGDVGRLSAHPVAGMANRAGDPVLLHMAGVLGEAGVIQDLVKVMAFPAQGVGPAVGATFHA